jgi:hypothetical protein
VGAVFKLAVSVCDVVESGDVIMVAADRLNLAALG